MNKSRLEAFSDGVIAIIITIMVLELRAPHSSSLSSLLPLLPVFISYIVSFLYIGIYWNNHHHMLSTVKHVDGKILWANLHLLFWLSLVPFVTAWMGENHFSAVPLAVYGIILLMSAFAYMLLQRQILRKHGKDSQLAKALGSDIKGKISPVFYLIAIVSTFFCTWIAEALYVVVALMWLIPDQRIEHVVTEEDLDSR